MLARSRKEIIYISNRKGTSRLRVREIARSHKLSEIPNREADWLRIEWISCNSIPFCNKKPASDSLLRPREPDLSKYSHSCRSQVTIQADPAASDAIGTQQSSSSSSISPVRQGSFP